MRSREKGTGMTDRVFGREYADQYDLLYKDKDYEAECDLLAITFRRFANAPVETVLDLGCGTGNHALPLAQRGYQVTGVDRSEEMLAAAQAKASSALEHSHVPKFLRGDIRTLDLGRSFDAVISMFAVVSYMTTNDDLAAAFRTARRHLSPGGLFFFDAWFGPAVLRDRPVDRYKIVAAEGERIIRFAHPELDVLNHTVQVNYKLLRLAGDRVLDEVDESHIMRFFFPQELTHYLEDADLRVVRLCPFMDLEREPGELDWIVAVVAEAR